jgi:hypothetical protein
MGQHNVISLPSNGGTPPVRKCIPNCIIDLQDWQRSQSASAIRQWCLDVVKSAHH